MVALPVGFSLHSTSVSVSILPHPRSRPVLLLGASCFLSYLCVDQHWRVDVGELLVLPKAGGWSGRLVLEQWILTT